MGIVPGGLDAHLGQFFKAAAADSPYVFHRESPEYFLYVLRPMHESSALEFRVFLAQFGGNLRKGLGRGDAH